MKLWMFAAILTICGPVVLTSCSKEESIVAPVQKDYFTLWNTCESLTALQDYVKDVTDPKSKNFIKEEDRIATFDMDGTLGKDEELVRTDQLIIKNLKTNKVFQISQEIGKVPVLSFGNSGGDSAMHNYCLGNKTYKTAAFMLIADDEARDHANREKALKLGVQWREAGYHVISMRDDFKTIYGDGVVKTDFSF